MTLNGVNFSFKFIKSSISHFFNQQFNIEASDNSNPARTVTTNVIVNVVRDESPPFFRNMPYNAETLETAVINSTFYRVTAQDDDLKVNLYFVQF